jgi:hypothetical protein
MKPFYSFLLLATVFGISAQAQSLNPGQVTDNVYNKTLFTERFSLVNSSREATAKEDTASAEVTEGRTRNAFGHKEINFTVSYNAEQYNFSGSKDADSMREKSPVLIDIKPQSHFDQNASAGELANINFMQLKLSLGSNNAAVTISNLKLNGMDITGSYTANTSGDIYWHLIYGEFGSNFTVTGTINVVNSTEQLENDNNIEIGFGSSSRLSPSALSVYWGNVNAGQKNSANIISWNTNKEENNDRFIIERATDGLTFTGIGLVTGAGNRTTVSNYNFTDNEFTEGNNFYRIKQVDMDGHASYSVVVHIINNTTGMGQVRNSKCITSNKSNKTASQDMPDIIIY